MLSFKLTQCLSYHDLSHDNMKWDGFGIGVFFKYKQHMFRMEFIKVNKIY